MYFYLVSLSSGYCQLQLTANSLYSLILLQFSDISLLYTQDEQLSQLSESNKNVTIIQDDGKNLTLGFPGVNFVCMSRVFVCLLTSDWDDTDYTET